MKFRTPEIFLGCFLTIAVFAMGMLFSSQYFQQGKGIDAKQWASESVQSQSDAQHTSPGVVKPASQPQQSGGHGDTYDIYGVKPGEFLLFLATIGLWYATNRLVRDARQTAKRQLRAYVVLGDLSLDTTDIQRPIFKCFALNTGQTPARNIRSALRIAIHHFPTTEEYYKIGIPEIDLNTLPVAPLGPQRKFEIEEQFSKPLDAAQLDKIKNGIFAVYISGIIQYEDMFGDTHKTYFSLYSTGVMYGSEHRMRYTVKGNDIE